MSFDCVRASIASASFMVTTCWLEASFVDAKAGALVKWLKEETHNQKVVSLNPSTGHSVVPICNT